MPKKSTLLLTLVLIMIFVTAFSFTGLSQEDDEIIDYVAEAVNRVTEQNTIQWTSGASMDQILIADGMEIAITFVQIGRASAILKDGDVSAITLFVEQEYISEDMQALVGDLSLALEMTYIDDELYVRLEDLSEIYEIAFEGLPDDDWFNINDVSNEQVALIEPFVNLQDILSQNENMSAYVEEFIFNIDELDGETLDGQAMRVFSFDVDMQAYLASVDQASILEDYGLTGFSDSYDELIDELLNSMTQGVVIWIGEEDGLPYYVEETTLYDMDVTIQGQDISMTATLTQITTYSNYNEPITIEIPIE